MSSMCEKIPSDLFSLLELCQDRDFDQNYSWLIVLQGQPSSCTFYYHTQTTMIRLLTYKYILKWYFQRVSDVHWSVSILTVIF